jgi:hypothetical protein
MFITVEDDLCKIPANIDVIITIKKTAKVIPTSNAANFALSFTKSLNAIFRIPFTDRLLALRQQRNGENRQQRPDAFRAASASRHVSYITTPREICRKK